MEVNRMNHRYFLDQLEAYNARLRRALAEQKRAKRKQQELVHMNKREVSTLDRILGRHRDIKGTPIHTYGNANVTIPDFLKRKPKQRNIFDKIREMGRGGDTEMVLVPRHMAELLDHIIHHGHKQVNPRTGLREYNGGLCGDHPEYDDKTCVPWCDVCKNIANDNNFEGIQNLPQKKYKVDNFSYPESKGSFIQKGNNCGPYAVNNTINYLEDKFPYLKNRKKNEISEEQNHLIASKRKGRLGADEHPEEIKNLVKESYSNKKYKEKSTKNNEEDDTGIGLLKDLNFSVSNKTSFQNSKGLLKKFLLRNNPLFLSAKVSYRPGASGKHLMPITEYKEYHPDSKIIKEKILEKLKDKNKLKNFYDFKKNANSRLTISDPNEKGKSKIYINENTGKGFLYRKPENKKKPDKIENFIDFNDLDTNIFNITGFQDKNDKTIDNYFEYDY